MRPSVHDLARAALAERDLDAKAVAVDALLRAWEAGEVECRPPDVGLVPIAEPGRPSAPVLVAPRQLTQRRLGNLAGRVAGVHAVAHIEANAVNLALDAVHRFPGLPPEYYGDWLSVAADEARHFALLRARLRELGADYGDLPAHDGLWAMALRTADDPLRRMALVPRVLEARGLDVSPAMIDRFRAAGDDDTAVILEVILREEVRHVAIGSHWFRWLCAERGVDPEATFERVLREAGVRVMPPINEEARLTAGFSEAELAAMSGSRMLFPRR